MYPACSWSTVDYYGVPKRSYYVLAGQLRALARLCDHGIDDADAGRGAAGFPAQRYGERGDYCVTIAAYDAALRPVLRQEL